MSDDSAPVIQSNDPYSTSPVDTSFTHPIPDSSGKINPEYHDLLATSSTQPSDPATNGQASPLNGIVNLSAQTPTPIVLPPDTMSGPVAAPIVDQDTGALPISPTLEQAFAPPPEPSPVPSITTPQDIVAEPTSPSVPTPPVQPPPSPLPTTPPPAPTPPPATPPAPAPQPAPEPQPTPPPKPETKPEPEEPIVLPPTPQPEEEDQEAAPPEKPKPQTPILPQPEIPPPMGDSQSAEKYINQIITLVNQGRLSITHTDLKQFDPNTLQDHYRIDLDSYEIEVSHSISPDTQKEFFIILFNNLNKVAENCTNKVILAYIHLTQNQFADFKSAADIHLEKKKKEEEMKKFKTAMEPVDEVLENLSSKPNSDEEEVSSNDDESDSESDEPEDDDQANELLGIPQPVPLPNQDPIDVPQFKTVTEPSS